MAVNVLSKNEFFFAKMTVSIIFSKSKKAHPCAGLCRFDVLCVKISKNESNLRSDISLIMGRKILVRS